MCLPSLNREILRRDGSAADAAVAGMFCVGVINTQSMGLGGGFLLTYYERATGKGYSLISREMAPAAAYEDMYHGDADAMAKGKVWSSFYLQVQFLTLQVFQNSEIEK